MKDLAGKTAVVTGAASGIGRALAQRFAAEKMQVVLADHDAPTLAATTEALAATGARVISVVGDVARGADVTELAARAKEAFGRVHLLCNNAGVGGSGGPMWTMTENDWTWTLGVNLWSVVHGVRAFVGDMIAHGEEAHVVNTASIAGMVAPPFMSAYVASKHAVVALSESLARELTAAGARVRVSVLCPGWVRTNIADSERHRPAELANKPRGATGASAANAGAAKTSTSDAGATDARTADPGAAVRKALVDAVRNLTAAGMDPAAIADHVLRAVHDERFYILPHAETMPAIQQRFRDISEDRYPRFNPDEFRKP